jgi:hypothetical protein
VVQGQALTASRYQGPIRGSSIIGKVVLTFWHDGRPEFHRF